MRYRNYLFYWLGLVASVLGYRSFEFAGFWLIHELTGSPLYLGLLGLATGLPAIILNVAGGVSADRFNKRAIVIATQLGLSLTMLTMGGLTLAGRVRPVHILVVAAIVSGVNAFNTPARIALYPQYVDREVLMSAVALNSTAWQGARVFAPAIAGVVIAAFGTAPAFFGAGVGAFVLAPIMLFLPDASPVQKSTKVMQDLRNGMRFIARTPPFAFLVGITFMMSFFALSYVTLMPVFAVDVLDVGAGGQGTLLAVAGFGSLLITLIVGTRGNVKHAGLMMATGAISSGLLLAVFAVTTQVLGSFPLSVITMFFVGASLSVFNMSNMTSLQLLVPDELRGRVMGFWAMTWNIMPLGGLFLGIVAEGLGAPAAVSIGGLIVVVAVGLPALFRTEIRRL